LLTRLPQAVNSILRSPYIYGSTTIRRLYIACIEGHPGVGLRVASFPNLNELGLSNFENGAIRIHPENKGFKRLHLDRLSTASIFLFTLLTQGPDGARGASPLIHLVLTHVNLEVIRLHHIFGTYTPLPLRPRSWQPCSQLLPSTIPPHKICHLHILTETHANATEAGAWSDIFRAIRLSCPDLTSLRVEHVSYGPKTRLRPNWAEDPDRDRAELKKLVEAVRSRPGGVAKALMTEADEVAVRSF